MLVKGNVLNRFDVKAKAEAAPSSSDGAAVLSLTRRHVQLPLLPQPLLLKGFRLFRTAASATMDK
ncbi:hypothetical protein E2C01_100122 [Portunus trituberculatus]|uniref:Uncharacterized protein n=1 Tax=Portunus trituberculatus TaxID=210409 RepID=A0A5B7KIL0_PORTR|nr:hypothetical protein [Portunus trituberculatus]